MITVKSAMQKTQDTVLESMKILQDQNKNLEEYDKKLET